MSSRNIMDRNCKPIGLVLMGIFLIFGTVGAVVWEGDLPKTAELGRPESLSQFRSFQDNFSEQEALNFDIFNPEDLTENRSFDASITDLAGFSLFGAPDDEDTFQGVVAINTERGSTVRGDGQFRSPPTDLNYMDIDVRNIIVISINTARGGNAIATSEIFIEPTQSGSCRS